MMFLDIIDGLLRTPRLAPGNGLDESLLSYVLRLSELNCIQPGAFVRLVQAGRDLAPQSTPPVIFKRSLGNRSTCPKAIVPFVESLGLKGQDILSMQVFEGVCNNPHSRLLLAWSPRFLLARESQYYPLLWENASVRVCPVSGMKLRSLCHQCGWPQKVMPTRMRVGQCIQCGAQFEAAIDSEPDPWDPVASEIWSLDYETWAADQTRRYIEYRTGAGISEAFSLSETIVWWLEQHGYSLRVRGSILWCPFQKLPHLFWAKSYLSFADIIEFCWKLGVGMVDFVCRRYPVGWQGLREDRTDYPGPRIDTNLWSWRARTVAKTLNQILEQQRYPMESLVEICAQRLKISTAAAYFQCPKIACKITERFLRTGRTREEVRQAMAAWEQRQLAQRPENAETANCISIGLTPVFIPRVSTTVLCRQTGPHRREIIYASRSRVA